MSEWKDISSYSRDESDRTPRSWEFRIGKIRMVVTRKWLGLNYGGWSGWHVECDPFLYLQPEGDDVEAIKAAALLELKNELTKHAALIETKLAPPTT